LTTQNASCLPISNSTGADGEDECDDRELLDDVCDTNKGSHIVRTRLPDWCIDSIVPIGE